MKPLDERAAVRRLFDRFGLGARHADVDDGVERGFDASLQLLLAPDPADPGAAATPAPEIDPLDPAGVDDPRRLDVKAERADQQQTMKIWWLDRMAAVGAPTPERLTWFWHGHFATSEEKVNRPNLMLAQNQTLRRLALGDFGSLSRAMIADPAMILWLDGQTNRLQEPNENLGRELMELFTLGVGHYSETDVRESARALTGWSVDPNKRHGDTAADLSTTPPSRPCSAGPRRTTPTGWSTSWWPRPSRPASSRRGSGPGWSRRSRPTSPSSTGWRWPTARAPTSPHCCVPWPSPPRSTTRRRRWSRLRSSGRWAWRGPSGPGPPRWTRRTART